MKTPPLQNPPRFRFSPDWREAEILLEIPLIPGSKALVTGSRDGSTYDWAIVTGDHCNRHSDDGYGNLGRAALDALTAAEMMELL